MLAAVLTGAGKEWEIVERPTPVPGPGEALVRVLSSGVGYMDVLQARGEMGTHPRIPGHEFVGEVSELGPGGAHGGPAVGDRVGVTWHQRWCRRCRYCVEGRLEICRTAAETGIKVDGGHAEYALVDAASTVAIPDPVPSDEAGPLMCAGYAAYSALREGGAAPGTRIGVVGIGGVGHLAVQYAAAMGAETIAVTSSERKVDDLTAFGAAEVVVAPTADAGRPLRDRGGFAAILLTGAVLPETIPLLLEALEPSGALVVVSVDPLELRLRENHHVHKRFLHYNLRIVGTIQGPRARLPEALDFHVRSGARVAVERFKLDRAPDALAAVRAGSPQFRAVLVP
jgi:D-arabinose 1-dehydrogenase-like Zn-dependent alcohol dehydrogenase